MLGNRLPALVLSIVALQFSVACGGKNGDDAGPGPSGNEDGGDGNGSGSTTGGKTGSAGGSAIAGKPSSGSGGSGSGATNGDGGADVSGDGGTADDPGTTPSGGTSGGSTAIDSAACSNGLDDDGDGLVDGMDPECTGATDQDEGTFATGIPGDNRDPKWQDCFFDGNSGAGDDGCRYETGCLYGDLAQTDRSCQITAECREFCQARTPNGCDCFGCCTIEDGAGNAVDILTGGSCSLNKLDDEEACPRCVKSADCENTCGRCELCPGRSIEDLPDDCGMDPPTGEPPDGDPPPPPPDGDPEDPPVGEDPPPDIDPPPYECENGRVCSDALPCPSDSYCQLGCCLVRVF